jgi:1-acyl-sn-glycerol-3-phosphate acyltransferase
MDQSPDKKSLLQIDVENVLRSKNPSLAKVIPSFIINYLKRIIHQDDINTILKNFGHLKDVEFIGPTLDFMGIKYKALGVENIPQSGRYFFVSNHPLGGLDGLVFMNELGKYYKKIKFPVNDILMNLENLSGIFLPINKHGGQAKEAIKQLEETYASDSQILYFPAGLCSRKIHGEIKDLVWHKSFISKAIQHKRDVVPAFFSGHNSNFFYNLSNFRKSVGIKANIEMLYLPDEMFRQKEKDISLVFGKPIPWQTFDNSKTSLEWADWVKSKSYELESLIKR